MSSSSVFRHLPARLAIGVALALPATAIAAPVADDAEAPADADRGDEAGVIPALATVGGILAQDTAGTGPYNPVEASVDYGTAINRFGGGLRTHEGQDMFAPVGTPEISPVATKVLETGTDSGRGNWAALYDPATDRTYVYMHMEEPAGVKAGDELEAGDQIGKLGCTGSCDGPHLHFEIRAGADPYGKPSDPLRELKSWPQFPGD